MTTKLKLGKILLAMILCVGYFSPTAVFAADEIKTEYNPLCWTAKECSDKRAELWGEERAAGGWLEKEGVECNKIGWGKCLAGNVTKTEVSFGGKTQFSNIGEYIKTVYNYGLVAIGILAVVVLIIAGAQWITSAGSAEVITQSKKRISGAIIGLFIAYMSFIILKSINPATVNLRLPQIYLIKSQILASKWCRDVPKIGGLEAAFAYAADSNKQSDKVEATGSESPMSYEKSSSPQFWCGQRFFVQGAAPDVTCLGDRCDAGRVCTDFDPVDEKNPYYCVKASIAGSVTGLNEDNIDISSMVGNIWEDVDDDVEVYLACIDNSLPTKTKAVEISNDSSVTDIVGGKQGFLVSISDDQMDDAVQECGGEANVYGAFVDLNITPNHSFNIMGEHFAIGAGGKVLWGGVYYEFIKIFPLMIKPELLIPFSSLKSGVSLSDIDSTKIFMSLQATHSFALVAEWVFGDKTMDQLTAEEMERIVGPYKQNMTDIGITFWKRVQNEFTQ
jgi:hypothetical protein